ncbi:hypothetical protein [Piscirickettsia salmonis]|uniref:hypothetical protein n=1 Tax=Piscirickettsia salmonis TaxID=1238 RepID=UPI0007D77CA4|nr:hypothetical protein A0O36_01571 [Piscirickettsiaceae bacterium NZ-RLO1]
MPKKIFIFDLDETLFCASAILSRLNTVEKAPSSYDPYHGLFSGCYTLKKEKMTAIMQVILTNGDEIGFITAGSISKESIKCFCLSEYGIGLTDDFKRYNKALDKMPALKELAESYKVPYSYVVFVDNSLDHIKPAHDAGFNVVYADNN